MLSGILWPYDGGEMEALPMSTVVKTRSTRGRVLSSP